MTYLFVWLIGTLFAYDVSRRLEARKPRPIMFILCLLNWPYVLGALLGGHALIRGNEK